MMKKPVVRIVLTVCAVLLVGVVATAGYLKYRYPILDWQAVWMFLTQDEEVLTQNSEDLKEKYLKSLEEEGGVSITIVPPSREQMDAILNGESTLEEVQDAMGITQQLQPSGDGDSSGVALSEENDAQKKQEKIVNDCVAELYSYQLELMAFLAQTKDNVMAEWSALSSAERTKAKRTAIMDAAITRCSDMEKQADANVKAVLDRYRDQMNQAGGQLSIFESLWNYYQEEKATEKAYYINQYSKYLS